MEFSFRKRKKYKLLTISNLQAADMIQELNYFFITAWFSYQNKSIREKLKTSRIVELQESEENYIFREDYIFNSPSTAGGTILGRSTNGWIQWKNKSGKTLDEVKRK